MRFSGVFATLAVVVALSGSVAWSMDMDMDMGMDSEKMVGYKAMDANKDGTVTRKEFRNFSKMKFKEIDKDDSGFLTDEELDKYRAVMRKSYSSDMQNHKHEQDHKHEHMKGVN